MTIAPPKKRQTAPAKKNDKKGDKKEAKKKKQSDEKDKEAKKKKQSDKKDKEAKKEATSKKKNGTNKKEEKKKTKNNTKTSTSKQKEKKEGKDDKKGVTKKSAKRGVAATSKVPLPGFRWTSISNLRSPVRQKGKQQKTPARKTKPKNEEVAKKPQSRAKRKHENGTSQSKQAGAPKVAIHGTGSLLFWSFPFIQGKTKEGWEEQSENSSEG